MRITYALLRAIYEGRTTRPDILKVYYKGHRASGLGMTLPIYFCMTDNMERVMEFRNGALEISHREERQIRTHVWVKD